MQLHDLLGLPMQEHRVVSICGGGGKTTLMYALARECCREVPTSLFTTTHIRKPEQDAQLCLLEPFSEAECKSLWSQGKIVAAGQEASEQGKFGPPREDVMSFLCQEGMATFIESDGAKMLPFKFPDKTREPVLRQETTHTVVVAGLSALGCAVEEKFFRLELAKKYMDIPEKVITEDLMARVLWAGYGEYHPIFLLNQADTKELCKLGNKVADKLKELGAEKVVVASLQSYVASGKI